MFCGHLDTVGVAGMARPFDPEERGGRLYARGAQDMRRRAFHIFQRFVEKTRRDSSPESDASVRK